MTRHQARIVGLSALVVLFPRPFHLCAGQSRLLEEVSQTYSDLGTYALDGVQTVRFPLFDCSVPLEFKTTRIGLTVELGTPSGSATSIHFHPVEKPSKVCLQEIERLNGFDTPGLWADFTTVSTGVTAIRDLHNEALQREGMAVECVVLDVRYDEYQEKIRHLSGPVNYWVDPKTHFIWKMEFLERAAEGLRRWTIDIQHMTLSAESSSAKDDPVPLARTTLIGKQAPNAELRVLGGRTIHLTDLRGKTVLLDFWAAWCIPCAEELPVLEEIQRDAKMSQVVVLGVASEDADAVQAWLSKFDRKFQTETNGESTFKDFGVEAIPMIVMVDREGVVRDYIAGFSSESRIRSLLRNFQ